MNDAINLPMRPVGIGMLVGLVAALFLLPMVAALGPAPRLYSVAAPLLAPGDELTQESIASSNPNLHPYLIFINGKMEGVVELSTASGEWKSRILDNPQEIKLVLQQHFSDQDVAGAVRGMVEKAHGQMRGFRTKRADGNEALCRQYTGLDRHPCTSFDTCQYACYSVTSLCYPMALGGGRIFLKAIGDFADQTKAMEAALEAEQQAYEALGPAVTLSGLEHYRTSLLAIQKLGLEDTTLTSVYGFCPPPTHDMEAVQTALEESGKAIWMNEPVEKVADLAHWMAAFASSRPPAALPAPQTSLKTTPPSSPTTLQHTVSEKTTTSASGDEADAIKMESAGPSSGSTDGAADSRSTNTAAAMIGPPPDEGQARLIVGALLVVGVGTALVLARSRKKA